MYLMITVLLTVTMLCSLTSAYHISRDVQLPDVSANYSVAGVQCWFEKRVDETSQEYNDIIMQMTTLEECQEMCVYAVGWVCHSLKYTAQTQTCQLSSSQPNSKADDMGDGSQVEHWDKICSENVEEGFGPCSSGYFCCKDNGVCIDSSLVCDGEAQCFDASDEEDCEVVVETTQAPVDEANEFCWASEFRCPGTTTCLSKILGCDGTADCPWGEDERGCQTTCQDGKKFSCRDSKRCISQSLVCNKVNDCLDYSDEVDCAYHCREGQMHCQGSSQCIPESWECDGEKDCDNGADELDCKDSALAKPQCKQQEFMCKEVNVCIFKKRVCDGQVDCPDGSDEEECQPKQCPSHDYLCPGTRTCIPKFYRCDYDEDCPGGEDESNCGTCHQTKEFTCQDSGRCIPVSWKCNDYPDCSDGSDEKSC